MANADALLAEVNQQITEIKLKYYSLAAKDRLALLILSIFLVGVIFFYAIWSPISSKADAALERYQNQVELMAWMKANESAARQVSASSGVGNRGGQSTLAIVNSTSSQNGIALKRFEPKGETGLRIWLENVSFDSMLGWLDTLNSSYGIIVVNITVETQNESGKVSATIIVEG